jgi:hypothetical protein
VSQKSIDYAKALYIQGCLGMKRIDRLGLMCVSALFLVGCGSLRQYHPLPETLENKVQMPGFHDVRAWADEHSKGLEASATQSVDQERAANHGELKPEMTALALSGGGSDGAFGAGFLCGWTKNGTRPHFKVVTGISTGSLIAPFAFLGSSYDARLERVYTTISAEKIYKPYSMFSIFMSLIHLQSLPSLASNEPLGNLIAKEIDEDMLKKIAAEHRKGRRLLVGTTQFNAQRLVIWNMGEIASVGTPAALQLFRKILLASSSIPVTFPPQYLTVEAEGKQYEEMHVDGGIEAQVMLYENAILPFSKAVGKQQRVSRPRKLYIIRNEKIYPEWENVKPQLKFMAVRSIDSLTKSQGIGDLFRLYTYALRDKIEYNLVFIPDNFKELEDKPFDNAYMRKVFKLGYDMGKSKQALRHYPPGFDPAVNYPE